MYGAIIGDIAGSKYEFLGYKKYPKTILDKDCFYTDDTVMTVAVADALLWNGDMAETIKQYGTEYPGKGYGAAFQAWLNSDDITPYFSYGNGSAMRVSAAAELADTWAETMKYATDSATVTHNHPEGIKGAQAVAAAIFMARKKYTKDEIRDFIEHTFGYDLSFTCDDIRATYKFNETCQETVPQAIVAFLDSANFEDAIKLAISLGGDADTLAAITGSIAEAFYGIPNELIERVKTFLPNWFIAVCDRVCEERK